MSFIVYVKITILIYIIKKKTTLNIYFSYEIKHLFIIVLWDGYSVGLNKIYA